MKISKAFNAEIIEEQNEFDDHLLDIIGNEFKFDHEKGLAEWLKNSIDAYIRSNVNDKDQYIILRFDDQHKEGSIFECIDFVGMSKEDITQAFKRWGDPKASKRDTDKKTTGGHGNGGKFYMRQMFKSSYFITYKDGLLNIYGFNENKKYGFASEYKNLKVSPKKAIEIAGISNLSIPSNIYKKILNNKIGFTVLRGNKPKGIKKDIKIKTMLQKIKTHPQIYNILSRISVSIIYNNDIISERLKPDKIKPKTGFEDSIIIQIPEKIKTKIDGEIIDITLSNKNFPNGKLVLRTSEIAFSSNSRYESMNRIDFMSQDIGVIASYKLYELGVKVFPQAAFIYGECYCPILENPKNDMVKNDRTKLNESNTTKALLSWISDQIDKLALEIAKKENKEQDSNRKKYSSSLNNILNTWKDKIMDKVVSNVLSEDSSGGDFPGEKKLSKRKKILEVPENIQFSYSMANIPLNIEYPLTLKAKIPDPIPVGSIIELISNSKNVQLLSNSRTITVEDVKETNDGQEVAVINILIKGTLINENTTIEARIGEFKTSIAVTVIEQKNKEITKKHDYPKVLLSDIDEDPLGIAPFNTVTLDPRQPVIYQRPQDIESGIYWINTTSYLSRLILTNYGENSFRWRDYLLQRYIDIFVKEALFKLQRKEPENFNAERVDSEILGNLITNIYEKAVKDLSDFLFDDDYKPNINE
jgi:hypothetical protein